MYSSSTSSSNNSKKIVRRACKAGSWYEANPDILDQQLTDWLQSAGKPEFGPARAIISPHAGYQYCGSCAAYAYKEISPEVSRIFILGPSHNVRLNGIALSSASIYEAILGNLIIDKDIYKELHETNLFEVMTLKTDEEEHSLELQLPFVFKVMEKRPKPFTIVPMMVGHLNTDKTLTFGKLFSKYLAQPENMFVISSDFCHWGQRFDYQYYDKNWGEIHESIEHLDKLGMESIKDLKLKTFDSYMKSYGNTICGRYPIRVMIAAAEYLNNEFSKQSTTSSSSGKDASAQYQLKFLNYLQSSKCRFMYDSSVSYAAGSLKKITS